MSKEIKAGTMVWTKTEHSWQEEQREYTGLKNSHGSYMCWTPNKSAIYVWDNISITDPHAPKTPWADVFQDDEEVWEYNSEGYFKNGTKNALRITDLQFYHLDRLRGFLHKVGDGSYVVCNSHLLWTCGGSRGFSMARGKFYNTPTKLIGAVMQKGGE